VDFAHGHNTSQALESLRTRWQARRDEFARFDATVHGARLCDELLTDLANAQRSRADEVLSLRDAASISGYSTDHLARLIRTGKIPDSRPRPRGRLVIRRADLPIKARSLHLGRTTDGRDLASRLFGGKEGR
jgi:hypothetical protein